MNKLNEGLRHNDLKHMMSNRVSIDEYESKIDDSAIVIAFYVVSKEAAEDANRFLQKSHVDILDTEISSSPDQEGYYLIFVEMLLNASTVKNIQALCQELFSLTSIKKWEFAVRGQDENKICSIDQIANEIDLKIKDLVESLLPEDTTATVTLTEQYVSVSSLLGNLEFELTDFGQMESVLARNDLNVTRFNLPKYISANYTNVKNLLGESWQIDCIDDKLLAFHPNSNNLLLIRCVDR